MSGNDRATSGKRRAPQARTKSARPSPNLGRLQAVVDRSADFVAIVGTEGTFTYLNDAGLMLLGLNEIPRDELAASFLEPESLEIVRAARDDLAAAGTWAAELTLIAADGTPVPIAAQLSRQVDADGNVEFYTFVGRDLTADRNARANDRAAIDQYIAFLEDGPDFKCIIAADGTLLYANRRLREAFPVYDGMQMGDASFLPRERERDWASEVTAELNRSGVWIGEMEFVTYDGEHVPVSVVNIAHRDASGEVRFYSMVAHDVSQLMQAQESLANRERWFRSIVTDALELLTVRSPDAAFVYVSPSVERIFGYTVEEYSAIPIHEIVHPDDFDVAMEAFLAVQNRPGASASFESRSMNADGEWRWLASRIVNMAHDPEIGGYVTYSYDVSDRKNTEAELQTSQQRFQALVQYSSDLFTVFDADSRLVYVSPSFEQFTGVEADELVGKRISDLGRRDDVNRIMPVWRELVEGVSGTTRTVVVRFHHHTGDWRWVEIVGTNLLDHPDVGGLVVNARDISERIASAEALRASEERFRSMVQNSSDIITVFDEDGTQKFISPAVERMLGYTPEEMIGLSGFELMHPDERDIAVERFVEALDRTTTSEPITLRLRHKDGTWRWCESIATNMLADPAINGIVTTTRSVHERHLAEVAMRRSEARLAAIVQNLSDTVHVLGPDGRLTFSTSTARFGGSTFPGAQGVHFFDTIRDVHPNDTELVRRFVLAHLEGREADTMITFRAGISARRRWQVIETIASNRLNDPDINGVVFTSRDVTRRRQAEQLVGDQARILEMVAKGDSLGDSLKAVAQAIELQIPGSLGAVFLRDGKQLRIGSAPSVPTGVLDALAARQIGPGGGTCAAAVRSGVLEICPDLSDGDLEERRRAVLVEHGIVASWSEPILASDNREILGSVTVFLRRTGAPRAGDLQVLQVAGPLAAIAIERKQSHDRLAHQAHHDPLTDLPNRTFFFEYLLRALARADRHRTSVAVLFLDLDRFKVVNDSLGHDAGDLVLAELASRLRDVVRPSDTVARFGGDEFTILCEDLSGFDAERQAIEVAERVLERVVDEPFMLEGAPQFLSGSIGIAISSGAGDRPESLLRDADAAMYQAKEKGRARWELFDEEMRASVMMRLATESALHQAIDRGELHLYYQPIIEVSSGRWCGVEALVRWQHPERGLIAPIDFITLAEETGLIVPLGAWVLQVACHQVASWRTSNLVDDDFVISVNLSARQLANPGLLGVVKEALAHADMPSSALTLEITESVLMDDTELAMQVVSELKNLGVGLSIDDFGTGYSSLGYLKRFPVDVVKIDRSFITGLGIDPEDTAIVDAVICLAHALGLSVTAEGVESIEQHEELRRLGCDRAQGYLFATPMPTAELVERLTAERITR
jgi:diguanylate cyclase (GGDEF)-like protein/PAS domain S-box-containing protein